MRARELGIRIGRGVPGEFNAITDVAGVTVGLVASIRTWIELWNDDPSPGPHAGR